MAKPFGMPKGVARAASTVRSPPWGFAQGEALGARLVSLVAALAEQGPVHLVSSPLGRAMQTASIINRHLGLPWTTDERLAEVSFGQWEGMTRCAIEEANPWLRAKGPHGWQFLAPGGESYEQTLERVLSAVTCLQGPCVIVAHGMCGRALRAHYAGQSQAEAEALPVPQDKVWRLDAAGVQEL
jgi:broad specificity phosphatase PhoE